MKDSNPYPDTVSDATWKNASTKEREFIRQHEEQHRRVKMMNRELKELKEIAVPMGDGNWLIPQMTNKVEEAMTGYWGERCSDHEAECPTCQAWGEYDRESALWEVQLEEFPDSIRCSRQEVMDTWILQGTTQFKAGAALQHGILNALLNNPIGVFYTCHDGQDYGYRYGSKGSQYYSFYVEV